MKGARKKGRWGENMAADFLKTKGYEILETGYTERIGEIDIIAANESYLVFIEVKTRKDAQFSEARESVTKSKQRKIIDTALMWLATHEDNRQPRFDVIELYTRPDKTYIRHIENAFDAE